MGFLFGLRSRKRGASNDIQTLERLSWSLARAFEGLPVGLLAGLVMCWIIVAFESYTGQSMLEMANGGLLGVLLGLFHAARLLLLQKVGGGYIFMHRSLLEYFAAKHR